MNDQNNMNPDIEAIRAECEAAKGERWAKKRNAPSFALRALVIIPALLDALEAEYTKGTAYAFYEICKELDIESEDIRKSGDSIDGIAARLAERIRETLRSDSDARAEALERAIHGRCEYCAHNSKKGAGIEYCKILCSLDGWQFDEARFREGVNQK